MAVFTSKFIKEIKTIISFIGACTFVPGDSKHLRQETMERAKNPHHCVSIVKQMHPDASGATFETDKDLGDSVPGLCYANFGIIGLTEKSRFQTCKFGRKFC